jgi:RNA polymerase sigma-70 factor (ECF subfamily)
MSIEIEHQLISRVKQGDVEAYGELVELYQTSVFNVCYRMLGERTEAEDLTQEAFLRAYRRLELYDANRPFGPWIRKIATNICLNQLKWQTNKSMIAYEEEHTSSEASNLIKTESIVHQNELIDSIRMALLELPFHYRVAIELRHFQDMSYEEMASYLGLPLNTVKSHLYRARNRLTKLLKEWSYV